MFTFSFAKWQQNCDVNSSNCEPGRVRLHCTTDSISELSTKPFLSLWISFSEKTSLLDFVILWKVKRSVLANKHGPLDRMRLIPFMGCGISGGLKMGIDVRCSHFKLIVPPLLSRIKPFSINLLTRVSFLSKHQAQVANWANSWGTASQGHQSWPLKRNWSGTNNALECVQGPHWSSQLRPEALKQLLSPWEYSFDKD